jgi:hypothetical protein
MEKLLVSSAFSMLRFLNFLKQDCYAVKAFVDEFEESIEDEEMMKIVPRFLQLKEYFEIAIDVAEENDVVEKNACRSNKETTSIPFCPLSRYLRLAILDHVMIMDINVSLLMGLVERE